MFQIHKIHTVDIKYLVTKLANTIDETIPGELKGRCVYFVLQIMTPLY